jgi:hypothetical protein
VPGRGWRRSAGVRSEENDGECEPPDPDEEDAEDE